MAFKHLKYVNLTLRLTTDSNLIYTLIIMWYFDLIIDQLTFMESNNVKFAFLNFPTLTWCINNYRKPGIPNTYFCNLWLKESRRKTWPWKTTSFLAEEDLRVDRPRFSDTDKKGQTGTTLLRLSSTFYRRRQPKKKKILQNHSKVFRN